MTIKEYRNLSPGDKREVHKDLAISILCVIACAAVFAAIALFTDLYAMG